MLFFECTDANYDLENNDSKDILSRCRYITLFHVPKTSYLQEFFKVLL